MRTTMNYPVRHRMRRAIVGRSSEAFAHHRLTLLAMCVAAFMIQIDVTIVNVALPRIQAGLHAGPSGLEWVISSYALALAALIPAAGGLGDRYGRKKVFLAGSILFTLGTVGCALSTTAGLLIAARAVEGAGGAAMLALSLSIITDTYAGAGRAAAIGAWAAIGGIGFGLGPVVGGVLLNFFSWPSVFWVNIPLAAIGIPLAAVAVRESRNAASRHLDTAGLVLGCAGLLAVTLGLIESAAHPWASSSVAAPLAAGAVLLVSFGLWERRCPNALVPAVVLHARSFLAACTIYLVSYSAFAGVLFYVTLLYQNVEGWSALRTGLAWLLMNIPFLIMAQLAGRFNRRFTGRALITSSCATAAAGLFALSFAGPAAPFAVTVVGYLIAGLGFGTLVPAVTHISMRDVPRSVSGAASGVVNAARQIGTSIGLAILGAIGVSAATSAWIAKTGRLAPELRDRALLQAQDVAGGQITAVIDSMGSAYRHPAVQSFVHGYQLTVLTGTACLFAAALIAASGFRAPAAHGVVSSPRRHRPWRRPSLDRRRRGVRSP